MINALLRLFAKQEKPVHLILKSLVSSSSGSEKAGRSLKLLGLGQL